MKKDKSRRSLLKNISLASFAALAATGCNMKELEEFFQRNFRTLSDKEKDDIINNLEQKYKEKYDKEFQVSAQAAMDQVEFAYALDLSRCVGCRKCVYACVGENNQSRSPQIHWIQVLQMEKEKGIDFAHSDVHYNPEKVPEKGHFYLPVACQQCQNPQCTTVCPVKATWQEPDGIVVVDYNWCIGCRYCMAACPYGARHFNWGEPEIPAEELNTDMHYLGNRPRMKGVVEKCTFCIQRVRKGKYPSCVEVCPVGARKFGNLLDPESEIRYILENKRVLVLKEELNTQPRFYYFFGV
ncbi:4Fe-4S dicluster domain-containing protein [Prolixibacteraceae bacterium Z1-6]|uniref:4Fe-4S dicluster domain-containing protein n=1 Tax=Draconibacterium aestuarii TaxID=2998507 RepID=A0A9X3F8Y9_9BACT|nr:4Fe-4S dicluster domain-containing protein [Prolixibacteraceae bacterium Z1-6]